MVKSALPAFLPVWVRGVEQWRSAAVGAWPEGIQHLRQSSPVNIISADRCDDLKYSHVDFLVQALQPKFGTWI